MTTDPEKSERQELVSYPQLCAELGISLMAWWRWQQDRRLAPYIPKKIAIRGRNYRTRCEAEKMKRDLVRQAFNLNAKREGK